jgi:hypothetical protein
VGVKKMDVSKSKGQQYLRGKCKWYASAGVMVRTHTEPLSFNIQSPPFAMYCPIGSAIRTNRDHCYIPGGGYVAADDQLQQQCRVQLYLYFAFCDSRFFDD